MKKLRFVHGLNLGSIAGLLVLSFILAAPLASATVTCKPLKGTWNGTLQHSVWIGDASLTIGKETLASTDSFIPTWLKFNADGSFSGFETGMFDLGDAGFFVEEDQFEVSLPDDQGLLHIYSVGKIRFGLGRFENAFGQVIFDGTFGNGPATMKLTGRICGMSD